MSEDNQDNQAPNEPDNEPQPEPEGVQPGKKGVPSEEQKTQRLKLEGKLEEQNATIEKLEKQLEELTGKDADKAAAVQGQLDEANERIKTLEAERDAQTKSHAIENTLKDAGCIDVPALLAHVKTDEVEVAGDGHISGLDCEALKEAHPYLFKSDKTVSTGAVQEGGGRQTPKSIHEALAMTQKG